ncbi:hypothetical protein SAMN02799630_01206 [Paenibacillus sp. UNCCL117]|uniref:hypothetical protein n=1 Tax=unclassified Paenibacillus TaxID=185978 RepID=UPI00089057BC|nr:MULTISPECIES: hypothetical protein [unclassified Paenibacillus]SDC69474.1 hypothetical protein SAMN04488602_103184 [Paenibacillus sp. cl123]SFW23937.1 hypothetical protein SAMN02799630_01206 [Paenibacillus sp. UNCCL117]
MNKEQEAIIRNAVDQLHADGHEGMAVEVNRLLAIVEFQDRHITNIQASRNAIFSDYQKHINESKTFAREVTAEMKWMKALVEISYEALKRISGNPFSFKNSGIAREAMSRMTRVNKSDY